jgi:hypothetical protein
LQHWTTPARTRSVTTTGATCRVFTGQAFEHSIKNLPWIVTAAVTQILSTFSRLVSSATIVQNDEDSHCIMYPVILGAQAVHVARVGEEPSLHMHEEKEDISLMVPGLAVNGDDGTTEKARLHHFAKEETRKVR